MANMLSERIAELRKERGLTQEQLGQLVGVSAQAVSKWEKGGAPDVELLPALADRLGVSIDSLFGREGGTVNNIDDTLRNWLLSQPEEYRLKRLCRLTWMASQSVIHQQMENIGVPDVDYCDSCKVQAGGEEILVRMAVELKQGLLFGVGAEDFSFMSIFPRPEAGYAAYFAPQEVCRRFFALLARPGCLELMERLHDDPEPHYYVPRVLAKQLNLPPEETEELLAALEGLGMVRKLNLELETGEVSAYIVHENWAFVPFLLFTRCLLEKRDAFYLLWDDFDDQKNREPGFPLGRLTGKRPPKEQPGWNAAPLEGGKTE